MDILITEKQLKKIIKKGEMDEQDTGPDPQPQAGTSAQQSGGQGYPEVGKWESGVTRGPANQIGITKWSDVVGASLKRDKANQLKEQVVRGKDEIKKLKQILAMDGKTLYAPTDTQIVDILDPSDFNIGGKITVRQLLSKSNGGYGNSETERWLPSSWGNVFPENSVISFMTPDGLKYEAKIRNPTLYELTKRHEFKGTKAFWDEFYSMEPQSGNWKFIGYFDDKNNQFKPVDVGPTFWEEWKYVILTVGSFAAAFLIPGTTGILISMGLDIIASVLQYVEGDNIGAAVSFILAFIPLVGRGWKWWNVSPEMTQTLAKNISQIDNVDDLYRYINELPNVEKTALQKLLKDNPQNLINSIDEELVKIMRERVTSQNAQEIVDIINKAYKEKLIKPYLVLKFFNAMNLKRLGFDFSVSMGIVLIGAGVRYGVEYMKELESKKTMFDNLKLDERQTKVIDVLTQVNNKNKSDYDNIISPILQPYMERYGETNEEMYWFIAITVGEAYLENPNQNFNEIAKMAENTK